MDSLELQLVRAWARYAEHLAGRHNQKTHANKYGSASAAKSSMRNLSKIEREQYKKRARKRAGLGAAKSEMAIVKAAQKRIDAAKNELDRQVGLRGERAKLDQQIQVLEEQTKKLRAQIDKKHAQSDRLKQKWYDATDLDEGDKFYQKSKKAQGDAIRLANKEMELNRRISDLWQQKDRLTRDAPTKPQAIDEYVRKTAKDREIVMHAKKQEAAEVRKRITAQHKGLDRQIKAAEKNEREKSAAMLAIFERDKNSPELEEASRQYFEATEQTYTLRRKQANLWIDAVKVDTPGDMSPEIINPPTDKHRQTWEVGTTQFNEVVGSNVAKHISVRVQSSDSDPNVNDALKERAYYRNSEKTVFMGNDRGARTVVHELGHSLEHNDRFIHEQALDFLNRRTAGDDRKKLSDVVGRSAYGDDEITTEDNFIDAYMGKRYEFRGQSGAMINYPGATEIVSMGLEYIRHDPKTLAEKDPEYFDFIYALMRAG